MMTRRILPAALAVMAAVSSAFAVDLGPVRAEPNLEKRSEKAMKAAEGAMSDLRKAAREGQAAAETQSLAELREAVEISNAALEQSGKNARRNPKYFKKAEITLRKLIRALEDYRFNKGIDEREPAQLLIDFLRESEDRMLTGIMTKKK